ncbi:MAG: hypothetical protein ACRDCG_02060 [Mycoplasmoidaceae bacterium]
MDQKKYSISFIAVTTFLQFFFFFFSIIFLVTIFSAFPQLKKHGDYFTVNIDKWINNHWNKGIDGNNFFRNFVDIFTINGWIIVYQTLVVLFEFSLLFYFLAIIFSFINLNKYLKLNPEEKSVNYFFVVFGIFTFWYWIRKSLLISNGTLYKHLFDDYGDKSINHREFWSDIFHFRKPNFHTITALSFYLVFLSTLIGFISIWIGYIFSFFNFEKNYIGQSNLNTLELASNFIALTPTGGTIVYFTQLTNILCFVYTITLLIWPKAKLFKGNSITISLANYIFIVGLIYWTVLYDKSKFEPMNWYNVPIFIETLLMHGSTPFLFFIFTLLLINFNKFKTERFFVLVPKMLFYPLFYISLSILISVFTDVNVYGAWTNINPSRTIWISGNAKKGNLIYLVNIIAVPILFSLILSLFWLYASFISKSIKFKNCKNLN